MVSVLTGMTFLVVGAGVYHVNTHSHDRQIIFPGLDPDQTVATLLGIGVVLIILGAARWLRSHAPPQDS